MAQVCLLMPFSDPQFDSYRLVLLSASRRHVLLEDVRNRKCLPRISIERWSRPAKEITDLVREAWQLHAVVLDFLGERPGAGSIVILEQIDRDETRYCPAGHLWAALDRVDDSDFTDQERKLIQRLISMGHTGRGIFSRLGWIEEVLNWVSEGVAKDGSQFSAEVAQLNGTANSCLVRFSGKDGGSYWFKAAAGLNIYEARITATLSSLFPEYLPELVGFHEEWHAWLMRDGGNPLSEYDLHQPQIVSHVLRRLADLQKNSIGHIGQLLRSGCHDHRMSALRAQIPELTPYLEEAMRAQDADTGPRITTPRIRKVAALIEEATFRLEDIGIPDTLMHCDIGLQNILIGHRGCVFTDWAGASVGNPLVTFEQLRIQLCQTDQTHTSTPPLTEIYQEAWRDIVTDCQFQVAMSLVPLIALASNLCCRRDWLISESLHRPQSQSYARILARQMDRAAQVIEQSIEACV
jgi:hypothetical protein